MSENLIDFNFDEEPDSVPQISIGDHTLLVKDIKDAESKAGNAIKVVELQVQEGSEEDGLMTWDKFNLDNGFARAKFKNFLKSVGYESGGSGKVDPSTIIGCTVNAFFKPNPYTNDAGVLVEATQVGAYKS